MDEIVIKARSNVSELVFLFHGYGADKNDLLPIGEIFSETRSGAEVHLPNGVESCDEGFGRQWFSLAGNDVKTWEAAFVKNTPKIMSGIDEVIGEKKLSYSDVIFAGFSQGAMMSLSLGLQYGVKAVAAFSGLLLGSADCGRGKKTKILLARGARDTVIPTEAAHLTEKALKQIGADVETVISPNLGHGIDNYLSARAVDFLKSL
ncbi:MAG: dienelactone hydrolase family protein [Holosporaceae bacterium]|nr:dienelactone hydrolase family protein [Holosporaceae bacterium]